MMLWSSLPLIALLATAANAGPAGLRSTCVESCSEGGSNFLYKTGYSYDYEYEIDTVSSALWAPQADLKAAATVSIRAVTPCEFSLSIKDAKLLTSSSSAEFSSAVTKNDLRFSFQNGKIDHVCGSEDEPTWVLNFKRGILSHFHNRMAEFKGQEEIVETDISGKCNATYSVEESSDSNSYSINKRKYFNQCEQGSTLKASLLSLGFERDYTDIHKDVGGSIVCDQKIKDGIFDDIRCFQYLQWDGPHIRQKLEATSTLKFKNSYANHARFTDFYPVRSTLIYEDVEKEGDLQLVTDLLLALKSSKEVVKKDTPRLFSGLVKALDGLTFEQLETLDETTAEEGTNKFFYDAILLVGSSEALKFVVHKDINQADLSIWLTSLSFMKTPTLQALSAVTPLLLNNPKENVMFTISSMIYNYCTTDSECLVKPEVQLILRTIESYLGTNCHKSSHEEYMDVIIALKSLGNAGRWIEAETKLQRCYTESNPTEVRIAAIEAWRKASCDYNRDHLLSTFNDKSQDTEVRIAAYLATMKCPSVSLINSVKESLKNEEVNQVGSFVWSHLTNLQESAAPEKQWIRSLIGEEDLQQKFSSEALKFSRYYESSFFSKELNLGGSTEANVIFSPDSYLPRSGMLNLTVDVFGVPLNLLEVGGRMKGLESYIERFFGPNGYYPDETIQGILKNMKESRENEANGGKLNPSSQPQGSFFVKLFGNEIFYDHFHDGIIPRKVLDFSNPLEFIQSVFQKGINKDGKSKYDFTKNFNLIDRTITVPSLVGFPVNLKLKSSASISVQLEGGFEMRRFNKFSIAGTIKPSASLIQDSMMELDAFVTKSGTTVKTTKHTATSLSGRAIYNGFELIDLKFDVPQERLELHSSTYELYVVKDGVETKAEGSPYSGGNEVYGSHTLPGFLKYSSMVQSNDFNLPSSTNTYIDFKNSHTSIEFRASFNPREGDYSILFDMPGGRTSLKHMVSLSLDTDTYRLKLESPYLNVKSNGQLKMDLRNPMNIELNGDVIVNDHSKYSGIFSYHRNSGPILFIDSKLVLSNSAEDVLRLMTNAKIDRNDEAVSLSFTSGGLPGNHHVSVSAARNGGNPKVSLEIDSAFDVKVDGFLTIAPDNLEFVTNGIYESYFGHKTNLDTSFKFKKNAYKDDQIYHGALSIGFLNLAADCETRLTAGGFGNKGSLKYNQLSWIHENEFSFIKDDLTRNLDFKVLLRSPQAGFNFLLEKSVQLSDKHYKQGANFELTYGHIDVKGHSNSYLDFWRYIKHDIKVSRGHGEEYSLSILGERKPGGIWTLKGGGNNHKLDLTFQDKSIKGQSIDYDMDVKLSNSDLEVGRNTNLKSSLKASGSMVDFESTFSKSSLNNDIYIKAKASHAEVALSSNIYKPFSVVGKFVPKEEGRGFEIKGSLEEVEVINAVAMYKGKSLEAALKYANIDLGFKFSLMNSGMEALIKWSPTEQISVLLTYETREMMSILASAQTPFPGWEKQEVQLNFSSKTLRDVKGQLSLTWANIQHLTFTLNNKLDSSLDGHNYNGLARITSSLEHLEIASLEINHEVQGLNIHTNVLGKFNDVKLHTEFKLLDKQDSYEASYFLKFPKRGISLESDLILLVKPRDFVLSAEAKGSILPDIKVKGSYKRTGNDIDANFLGNVGTQSTSLLLNTRKNVDSYKMLFKFNSPFTTNFEMNYRHKLNQDNSFEAAFDMTSIIYPGEKNKVHVVGDFVNVNNMYMSGYINAPKLAGKVKVTNQFSNGKFKTMLESNMNKHALILTANGEVDSDNKVGFVNLETKSSYHLLNEINIMLKHEVQNGRSTKLSMTKDSFNAEVFAFYKDWSNNELKIDANNLYKFHLKKYRDYSQRKSEYHLEIKTGRNFLKFHTDLPFKTKLEFAVMLPWVRNVEFKITPKQEGISHDSFLKIGGYEFTGELTVTRDTMATKGTLINTWSAENIFVFDGEVNDGVYNVKVTINPDIEINADGNYSWKNVDGKVSIQSNINRFLPISLKFSGIDQPQTRKGSFTLENKDNKLSFDIAKVDDHFSFAAETKLSWIFRNEFNANLNYKFDGDYLLEVAVNEQTPNEMMIKGKLEKARFEFHGAVPSRKLDLELKWDIDTHDKSYEAKYDINSVMFTTSAFMKLEYNIMKRSSSLLYNRNGEEWSIKSKYQNDVYSFDVKTPIDNWENLNAMLKYKQRFIEAQFLQNSREYKFTAQCNFDSLIGEGEIQLVTPIQNYKKNSVKIKYEKSHESKNFNFEVDIGSQKFNIENSMKSSNTFSKINMKMNIYSFITQNKNLDFDVNFNQQHLSKSLSVKGIMEDKNFNWVFTIEPSKIDLAVTSNILGWKVYELKGTCEKMAGSMKATVKLLTESVERTYSIWLKHTNEDVHLAIETPIPGYSKIIVNGNYESINDLNKLSADVTLEEKKFHLIGEVMADIDNVDVKFIVKNDQDIELIDLNFEANPQVRQFDFSLKVGGVEYKANIYTLLYQGQGSARIDIALPFKDWSDVNIKGNYDFVNGMKAEFEFSSPKYTKYFLLDGAINNLQEINLDLITPFEGLEKLKLQGRYRVSMDSSYLFESKAVYNDASYELNGKLLVKDNGYSLQANVPFKMGDELLVNAVLENNRLEMDVSSKLNLLKSHKIVIEYQLDPVVGRILMYTTFDSLRKLEIMGKCVSCDNQDDTVVEGAGRIMVNDDVLNIEGKVKYEKYDSLIEFSASTSDPDEKYYFKTYLDLIKNEKTMGIIFESPTMSKKLTLTSNYQITNPYKASFIVTTSLPDFEKFGLSYDFYAEPQEKECSAYIKVIKNENEYSFGAHGIFQNNRLMTKILSPFEEYREISLDGFLKLQDRRGKLLITVGNWQSKFEASFNYDEFGVEVLMPFRGEKLHFISKHVWSPEEHLINFKFEYDDDIFYQFYVNLPTPSINFIDVKVSSPFELIKNIEFIGGFNLKDPNKVIKLGFTYNEIKYLFSTNFYWSMCEGGFELKLMSPSTYWGNIDIHFDSSISLGKFINLSLKRNENYDILIKGLYSDDVMSYALETPYEMVQNFKSYGSYNKVKRSVELKMMNDHHHGEILHSFNSLKVVFKTPFERLKTFEWELERPKGGGLIFNYKRNEHHFHLSAVESQGTTGTDITLKGAFPAWEIPALFGRVDDQDIEGYLTGRLVEKQMTMSGNGHFGKKKGNLKINIETPLPGYEKVDHSISYDYRKRLYKIEGKAENNNDMKFLIEAKRGVIFIDINVPHPEQSTIIKGRLTIYKGKLDIKSRCQFIKSYSLTYKVDLGIPILAHFQISRNGIERVNFHFEQNAQEKRFHFHLMVYLLGNKSTWHYQRDGFKSLEMSYTRNDKELKLEATGTGDLPNSGKIEFTTLNSFKATPRKFTGDIELDRTTSPKKATVNIYTQSGFLYTLFFNYNIDLGNLQTGDYTLRINTPDKRAAPWKSISGNWNIDDHHMGSANIMVGPFSVTGSGKFSLFHTDLTFDHNLPKLEKLYLGWKIFKKGNALDYYLKFGRENRYVMAKFKGTINGVKFGDIQTEFRASKYMDHDLIETYKWEKQGKTYSGSGTFKYGPYSGKHTFHYFRRNAEERAAEFKWDAKTNIPEFNTVALVGQYSLKDKLVDIELSGDSELFSIKGQLNNFSTEKSDNTITGHIPYLGDGFLRVTHDFTNPLDKKISAVGELGGKPVSYNYERTSNADHSECTVNVDVDSTILGKIQLTASYDVSDMNNANAMLKYTRNSDKFVDMDWSRKVKKHSLDQVFNFKSHFLRLPSLKAYISANWKSGFSYVHAIECHDHVTKLTIEAGDKRSELSFASPLPFLDDISAVATYNLKGKTKTFSLDYQRGSVIITTNVELKTEKKKSGSFKFDFTSPYKVAKTFSIDAQWKKGNLKAQYQRNDIEMTITGKGEIKPDKSSFEVSFTPPGKNPVNLEVSYDFAEFKVGGSTKKELLKATFDFAGQSVNFNLQGYRNSDKVNLELAGSTSFEKFKSIHVLLDSELNLTNRQGHLMIHVDDFEFDMRNKLTQDKQGFMFESNIDSSLTPLPGIKIGIGRDKSNGILTLGVGDEKEISITFDGKDDFREGFSGKIDLPHRNIKNVDFDIGYSFKGENKLEVDLSIDLGGGKKIEGELIYNSDGVKTRLSSPWTGNQNLRIRRSLYDMPHKVAETTSNCGVSVLEFLNRGYFIEGELLGKKIKVDLYLDKSFHEGRFILNNPFDNFDTIGWQYKIAVLKDISQVRFSAQVHLPYNDPVMFNFIGDRAANEQIGASLSLEGVFGTHTAKIFGKPDDGLFNIEMSAVSEYLPDELKIKVDYLNFKRFEISSDAFTWNLDLDFNRKGINIASSVIQDEETIFDIDVEAALQKNWALNVDGNFKDYIFKLQNEMSYSHITKTGHGLLKVERGNKHSKLFKHGLNCNFNLRMDNNEFGGSFTFMNDNDFYPFDLSGSFIDNKLKAMINLPFDGYRTLLFDGFINPRDLKGKFFISMDGKSLNVAASLNPSNTFLLIETPFEQFSKLNFRAKYEWTGRTKLVQFKFEFNHILYNAYINIPTAVNKELDIKLQTPFNILKEFEVTGGINLWDIRKFVKLGFIYNDFGYLFSTVLHWEDCKGGLNARIRTPFREFEDIQLDTYISLGKHLIISLKRNGIEDMLIKGRYSDEDHFDPIMSTENYTGYDTYNRAKRSLDTRMMNDHHHGDIYTNFNSLEFKLNTPFERIKTLEWEIQKPKDGGLILNYKRNNHHMHFSVTKSQGKIGLDISIKGAIPAWEILAVTGRLDQETLMGYLSGRLDEKQLTISGNGLFQPRSGKLNIDIQTPFSGYEQVSFKLDYNRRRGILTLVGNANDNDFKFLVEFKRGVLTADVFIPHDEQPTIINGKLGIYKGKLEMKSRFPLIKSYKLSYGVDLAQKIIIHLKVSRNDIERVNLHFEQNAKEKRFHFHLMVYLLGNKSTWHYQRDGFKSLEMSYTRNDKELKLEATGTGDLPNSGKIDFTTMNSFKATPRKFTGDIELDRTTSPKKATVNIYTQSGFLYTLFFNYNIDLANLQTGDYTLRINTPDKRAAPWKSISGNWNIDDHHEGSANIMVGPFSATASGRFSLFHTDLTFDHNLPKLEKLYLGWKIFKDGNSRDYYFKFGRENRYVMAKLKGTINGPKSGDIQTEFRASKYMDHDLIETYNWKKQGKTYSGSGTFKYGPSSGKHTLHYFKRNADERAAEFKWDAKTNIPEFNTVTLVGQYSLKDKLVDIELSGDSELFSIKGQLNNFSPQMSDNTITGHIPYLGDGFLRVTHDFTNPLDKKVSAVGELGGKPVSYNYERTSNADHSESSVNVDVDSTILGKIKLTASYDISDMNNANAMLKYTRNSDKFVDMDWSRKVKKHSLDQVFNFKSHFLRLPSLKAYISANWKSGFSYVHAIECHNHVTKLTIEAGDKRSELSFTSPLPFLDDISAVATYNLKGKTKTFSLDYQRGSVIITTNVELKTEKKKSGSFKFDFTSPYKVAKTFSIDAQWKKGNLKAQYQRNDVEMTITGKGEIKPDKSSFEVSFTPPGKSQVNLEVSYDLAEFKVGGSTKKELLKAKFDFAGQSVNFNLQGYRNSDKVNLELTGSTSFKKFKSIHVLLDSELNLANRQGHLMIHVDDFEFDMRNKLTQDKQGFMFESNIDSSLTPLPGIKFGIGRDKSNGILTLGVGDEKEISITFNGKDDFRKGFSGKIDLPHRNIKNVDFDIGYSFKGENKLEVDLSIDLGGGKKIEGELVYNSEGVKTRLSTPWSGLQNLRIRRSIHDDYYGDSGPENCIFSLSKFLDRGFLIEGLLLGQKFKVDLYLNKHLKEGRFLFNIPFYGLEEFGGEFKTSTSPDAPDILDAQIQLPYGLEPITFTLIVDARPRNFMEISGDLNGIFGSHRIDVSVNKGTDFIDLGFKCFSHLLPSKLTIRFSKSRPLKLVEVISDNLSFKFNYDLDTRKTAFDFGIYFELYGKIYSDFMLDFYNHEEIRFTIDANFMDSNYKLSSNLNYSPATQKGKGHFIGSMYTDHSYRLMFEIEKEGALAEISCLNVGTHTLRMDFKFPADGKEISMDLNSKYLPKMNFKYVRMSTKPFKISFGYENHQGTYLASVTTDIKFTKDFSSHKNAFFKVEILVPMVNLPYSLDLKYYNQQKFKGIKVEVSDGHQLHTLSGKLSIEDHSGKFYLLVESPLLDTTQKIYLNLAYEFEDNFKLFIETMENMKVSHSFFLEYNPREKTVFANIVSPYVYSGIIKFEARIGEYSSSEGNAQLSILTGGSKISANLRCKMQENEVDAYVAINTPFKGLEEIKFGGKYIKGPLTKVVLFAEPYNFKASTHFGMVNSSVNCGIELKSALESWEDVRFNMALPLNRFAPKGLLDVGYNSNALSVYFDRKADGGKFGWNISRFERDYEVYYRTKAPFEFGTRTSRNDIPKYHIMFDSSFLVLSDAAMVLM